MLARDWGWLCGAGIGLAGLSLALSSFLSALMRRWAPRFGLVDRPGGHKGHKTPPPRGGGVAIWLTTVLVLGTGGLVLELGGASLPSALARYEGGLWSKAGPLALIFGMATLIMVMGLIDDRTPLPWQV